MFRFQRGFQPLEETSLSSPEPSMEPAMEPTYEDIHAAFGLYELQSIQGHRGRKKHRVNGGSRRV